MHPLGFKAVFLVSTFCMLGILKVSNVLLLFTISLAHIRSMNIFKSDGMKHENLRLFLL